MLSGGYGSRLSPLTDIWPKCLMPINKKPLLEYWIDDLVALGIDEVLINLHHFSEEVIQFLERDKFKGKVNWIYERELLGTAGTLQENHKFFKGGDIFLAHADNFCTADLSNFMEAHRNKPKNCIATMMTFLTNKPESCGIVVTNSENVLIDFYEKVANPPSNLANAAVYLLNEEILDLLIKQKGTYDFSIDVIPKLLGKVRTWNNDGIHIDIGTIENLLKSQDCDIKYSEIKEDQWHYSFLKHPIHKIIDKAREENEGK